MRLSVGLSLVLATTVLAACDSATEPSNLFITTDASRYTAVSVGGGGVAITLVTTLRNPTDAPITLERCNNQVTYPIYHVELVSGESPEGAAYNPDWACVGMPPFVVGPGQTRVDTVALHGQTGLDSRGNRLPGTLTGTFRLFYGAYGSNTFSIELPSSGVVPSVRRDLTPVIQTDSQLVHLRYRAPIYESPRSIRITMYNPTADTWFITNCNGATGVYMEKQVANEWTPAWSAVVPACASTPIAIPPNGHHETSLTISGGASEANVLPKFTVKDVPGVYRLVWTNISSSPPTVPIAIEYRRSNAFAIVVDP